LSEGEFAFESEHLYSDGMKKAVASLQI